MSIMVRKLYKNGALLYKMNLIAGKNGLDNLVQWVHIIEDDAVCSFLHGNELVFTAGILNHDKDWLLNFAHSLFDAGVSALVVNIGPHTKEISQEVINYCNKINLPLFTIPWETKMVDMTRDFCHRIMNNEQDENNIATTIKNIIFKVGDNDAQVIQMERHGYQRHGSFCFISITSDNKDNLNIEEYKEKLKLTAEKIINSKNKLFISFSYIEYLILVLVDFSDADIEAFVSDFTKTIKQKTAEWDIHMGISPNQNDIYNQNVNFEKAFSAMKMACRRKELYNYYSRLGIYKVLFEVGDKTVLRDFYNDSIGKLETYDRENNTQFLNLLQTYLENNGSIQLVSEKQYIHRNTVTNQLKKIEKITGYNPLDLDDKVRFALSLYIKDVL